MRFAMIFEGVDRATKVMQKIMSAEKAAASASIANSKKSEAASNRRCQGNEKKQAECCQ